MLLTRSRLGWYLGAIAAALSCGALLELAHQRTSTSYPAIAGFSLLAVFAGGTGPSVVAGLGSLAVAMLLSDDLAGLVASPDEGIRFFAAVFLIVVASFVSGLFRRSRMATSERAAQLRAAADNLQELLDGSSDGIMVADADRRIVYVNAPLLALLGVAREALIGRALDDAHTAMAMPIPAHALDDLRVGDAYLFEHTIVRSDERHVRVEASLRMLPDRRVLAAVRDISVRRAEQESQLAERDLLNGILATSVAGVLVVNLEGDIIFANQRAEDVLGLVRSKHPDAHYEQPAWHSVALDGGPWAHEERPSSRVQATGQPVLDVRHGIVWPDGRHLVLSVNASPLFAEDGRIRAVVVAVSDVTAALDAQRTLRERDEQLAQVTAAMPGLAYQYEFDVNGNERFLFVSEFVKKMLTISPDELLADASRSWSRVHPDDAAEMRRTMMVSYETLQPWAVEFRLQDIDRPGAWRWISARGVPERTKNGQAVRWDGIMVDVTDRHLLEDQLRQAQRLESIGRLAGGIAHDFNNLLTAILGHAEVLSLDAPPESEMADSLAQIRSAAESGSALTRQLLGFARKQVVAPQLVDVNELVSRLPLLVQPIVGDAVSLQIALDPEVGRARVDPVQLQQVLMNLIVNAVDAMPSGGPLLIETSRIDATGARLRELPDMPPGELVEIVVRDFGSGMTEDVRARAFEPFFTTKEIGRGTGLGLSTSYGIVSQAGGTIELVSAVGRGTSVHVLLPVTVGPAVPVRAEVAAVPKESLEGSETILVVDDDPGVLRVTSASLRRFGYHVIEARSGEHALAASRLEPGVIHLLVTDVVMPGMSGRELADILRRERPATPVLFVSGYPDGTIAHHGVVEEGVALLSKPFERAVLARRVRTLLDAVIPVS